MKRYLCQTPSTVRVFELLKCSNKKYIKNFSQLEIFRRRWHCSHSFNFILLLVIPNPPHLNPTMGCCETYDKIFCSGSLNCSHIMSYRTVLYCTVLYCTVLYCTVLYCTVLYCSVLYCTVLYCTVWCGDVCYMHASRTITYFT